MKEVWEFVLFQQGAYTINVGQVSLIIALVGLVFMAYRQILKKYFPKVFENNDLTDKDKMKIKKIIRGLLILLLALAIIMSLNLDRTLLKFEKFDLSVLLIIKALFFIQIFRILNWFISNVFIHSFYKRRDKSKTNQNLYNQETESSARKILQIIFYLIVGIYLLKTLGIDASLFKRSINGQEFDFNLSNILIAVLVIFIARLIVWVITQLVLHSFYKNNKIEVGSQFAINQLVAYVIYIFAAVMALDELGINMSILLGGAAALLVGIGLGLQQTFNDFISGIVLLFERSVAIGDILEFNDTIGTVKKIGLRSSILETRGNVSMVVPNHLLVNESITNWTHYNDKVRFNIKIGVAYGSDATEVKKILLESVKSNPYVIEYPAPFVRFENFGDSSLDFTLYFFSRNYMVIEDIKSDLRLEIDRLFREHEISIPFPQRVVTVIQKKEET